MIIKIKTTAWKCTCCDHKRLADERPARCGNCGKTADFEPGVERRGRPKKKRGKQ